jgi:hypothetical protein
MPYRNWADSDSLTAADLNAMTADALTADIATLEGTTSTAYTDLTTVGPAVTLTLVSGQGCLVIISAKANSDTAGATNAAKLSFAVSGIESLTANDANAAEMTDSGSKTATRITWYVAGTTGSHTFTMKYEQIGSGQGVFQDRRIIVKKF